jgi:methylenetetrahydrofolate dehydrogenase (NADP+)/methenyltetrahydrofolate cyclohydrolase
MPDMVTILDGRKTADELLTGTAARVQRITQATRVTPGLATVLVGDDPASATYVRMKAKRCESVGMKSIRVDMPAWTTTDELVAELTRLGDDPAVHGILLQHPAPKQIDERLAFEAIPADKDVDGVTIASFGAAAFDLLDRPGSGYGSCTPAGIMTLLKAYHVELAGKHAVVIGRSPILGKPMAMMLLAAHCTVTICHSKTRDLADVVRLGDVVVAAVGRPAFVQGDWIRPGAVVVDAGYNPGNVGDVAYEACAARASMITPVPGGVGPMTIATLIDNTAIAAARQLGVA